MDVPALMPVTTPVPDTTVAIAVLLLLHVPPPVALANVVVEPSHTLAVPVFAAGPDVTFTVCVREQPDFV